VEGYIVMSKLVFDIGINDLTYPKTKSEKMGKKWVQVWRCPFYERWYSILRRCYSTVYQKKQPTYKDCYVCEEWLTFSNFKSWMEKQDWEGKSLDKDILFEGNKEYHPDKCVFVPQKVNNFLTDRSNHRGSYPLGVTKIKTGKAYLSSCQNPFTGERGYIGCYDNPEEAHWAYRVTKYRYAQLLADTLEDVRVAKALVKRYKL
tara:strand:- start:440 stop:1048 length:609 start_codon:yes stop_codon:yes gene_type:complete